MKKAASLFSGELSGFIKGGRHEFAGHKPYSPGDDFRYIDWNAASRSDTLHSKTFFAESSGKVHIWVDTSTSMFPKLNETFELAIALAFLAMKTDAETSISFYTSEDKLQFLGSYKNKASIFEVINILKTLDFKEYAGVKIAKDRINKSFGRNSQIILLSDGYDEEILQNIRAFAHRNFLVLYLQMLSQDEIAPKYFENMLLLDSEMDDNLIIRGNSTVRESYSRELDKFIAQTKAFCKENNVIHKLCNAGTDLHELLTRKIMT